MSSPSPLADTTVPASPSPNIDPPTGTSAQDLSPVAGWGQPYDLFGGQDPWPGWVDNDTGVPGENPHRRRRARSGLAGVLIAVLVLAVGAVAGGAATWLILSSGPAPTSSAPAPSSSATAPAPGAEPEDTQDDGASEDDGVSEVGGTVKVGECITLTGPLTDAAAEPAACGSAKANYKVVAKAETADQCPVDIDQAFYETDGGGGNSALCLDIDWAQGDCFELSGSDPQRVRCTAPGPRTVRIEETLQDTVDVDACDEGGFPYPERQFVVCAEELGPST